MADASVVHESPEFHIVVRRPGRRSPLAPYRFAITFAFAMAVCGMPLWEAVESGGSIDDALLRVGGAALFAWFVLGRINAILSSAPQPASVRDSQTSAGADATAPTPPTG